MSKELILYINNIYCIFLICFTAMCFAKGLFGKSRRFYSSTFLIATPLLSCLFFIIFNNNYASSLCFYFYLLWLRLSNRRRTYRFFMAALFLVVIFICNTVIYFIAHRFNIEPLYNNYSIYYIPVVTIFFIAIGAVFYLLYFFLEKKKIHDINPLIILMILPSALYLYVLTIVTDYFMNIKDDLVLSIICIVAVVCSLLASFFAIRLSNSLRNKAILEQKLDFVEQYGKLSTNYSRVVEDNLNEMRKIRHDFNNSMQVIQTMIAQNHLEEATQLSQQLQDQYASLKNQAYCENITINTILQQEQRSCEKDDIDLRISCTVPKELAISQVNLCSILTNLLHNAERAVQEIPADDHTFERMISLSIWVEGDMLFFRLQNPTKTPVVCKEGKLVTTKLDKKNHGLGMEIIKQIAAQYDGEVIFDCGEQIFSVIVALNLDTDKSPLY